MRYDPNRTAYADHVVEFHQRVVQDAFSEATAAYWERRATAFEDAAPRPGDYPGMATPEELSVARERCLSVAAACRARASLEAPGQPVEALVASLWEVA